MLKACIHVFIPVSSSSCSSFCCHVVAVRLVTCHIAVRPLLLLSSIAPCCWFFLHFPPPFLDIPSDSPISALNISIVVILQVNISVTDTNDNSPQFSVSHVTIPVSEDTPLSATIYIVDAHDADSADNGRVHYALNNPSNLFTIDSQSGCIKLKRSLDYERTTQHDFVVIAMDSGRPSRQSSMDVTINVQDVNDNSPTFEKTSYEFTVSESVKLNTKFAQVAADDPDSGNNKRMTYVIHNGASSDVFGIFPSDGFLYTKTRLDHEAVDRYDLHVVAIDNGIPAKSTTVPVTIRVLDVNDNGPTFDEASYKFRVTENRPPHSVVGFVMASDSDTSDVLRYELVENSERFMVVETSGEIITRVSLDRETRETYRLVIHVSDQGAPPNTATVEVEIVVNDVNDNSPVFDRVGHYIVEVEENQPEGTIVTQVSARDSDKGENGTVSYYFGDGKWLVTLSFCFVSEIFCQLSWLNLLMDRSLCHV